MELQEVNRQINPFVLLLWWCSGATPRLLKELPTEWGKYAATGATVLSTALLAALSGGYAIYLISRSILMTVIFGAAWGLTIFNLDRFIVSTMSRVDRAIPPLAAFTERLLKALPRLLLVVLIAIVISVPLRMKIFEKEIDQQIYRQQGPALEDLKQKITVREVEINNLKDSLNFETERLNKLSDAYLQELDGRTGTNGSGIPGAGPLYRQRLERFKQAEAESRARRAEIQRELPQKTAEIAALKNQQDDLNRVLQTTQSSLVKRMEILFDLGRSNPQIALAGYFITLLFILLEASPVLVKLLTPKGPYEDLMNLLSRSSVDETSLPAREIDMELREALSQALDHSLMKARQKT